ncbi:cytochrome P450, partial [Nonomuraea zeae]
MTVEDRFGEGLEEERKNRVLGTYSETVTDPVSDWATDFSHVDPTWAADPYPIQDDLRQRCPIARTERFGGAWLPTRYEDVAAIAYDTEHFSSRAILISNNKPPLDLAPAGDAPPITSD